VEGICAETRTTTIANNKKAARDFRNGFSWKVKASPGLDCTLDVARRCTIANERIRTEQTKKANFPFSDAVWAGNTLYISGHLGLDPQTHKPPATAAEEARLVMDGFKKTVETAGLTMGDLVSLQIFCSDVSLFAEFNTVYRTYFTNDEFPTRAFLGSGKLLFDARFEVQGIAYKK
jgi:reactive intermediate/imine deaminase